MIVELGTFRHDVTHHAVVVGLLRLPTGGPPDPSVAAARRLADDGAAAVELVGAADGWAEVVDALGDLGLPVGATVRDEADLARAAAAGVGFVAFDSTDVAAALGGVLLGGDGALCPTPGGSGAPARWSPSVIAPPAALEALSGRLSAAPASAASRLPQPRRIAELDLAGAAHDRPGGARGSGPFPSPPTVVGVALSEHLEADAAAATTIAVHLGARVIRTRAVRPARRAADLCATLLLERAGAPARDAA